MFKYEAPPGFDARVRAKLAIRWPAYEFRATEPGAIDVFIRSSGLHAVRIGLTSVAQRVRNDPQNEDKLVDELLDKLPMKDLEAAERGEHGVEKPEPEDLFPRLVPAARFAEIEEAKRPELRPHHGEVSLAIVASYEQSDRYLLAKDFADMGLTWDAALERALANLEELIAGTRLGGRAGADGKPVLIVIEGHPHAAAAILLNSFPGRMTTLLGGEAYACLPGVDELVIFKASEPDLVKSTVAIAKKSFDENPYPVTDQVFKVTADAVTPTTV